MLQYIDSTSILQQPIALIKDLFDNLFLTDFYYLLYCITCFFHNVLIIFLLDLFRSSKKTKSSHLPSRLPPHSDGIIWLVRIQIRFRWTHSLFWSTQHYCSHCYVFLLLVDSVQFAVQEKRLVEETHHAAANGRFQPNRIHKIIMCLISDTVCGDMCDIHSFNF